MKQNDEAAILAERAELTAYRTSLQNLLLEVARETGAEKLNAIREASLGAIAELAAPESELTRHQSAAIVHQCFDTVAAQAGFTIRTPARDVH
jgi:hypothetical protein